jgi:hypothetical protein
MVFTGMTRTEKSFRRRPESIVQISNTLAFSLQWMPFYNGMTKGWSATA